MKVVTRVKSTLSTSYNKCNYQVPNKELYYNATFAIKNLVLQGKKHQVQWEASWPRSRITIDVRISVPHFIP